MRHQIIRVFDVDIDAGKLTNGKLFVEKVATDGIRVDIEGNLWFSIGWGDPRRTGSTATARAANSRQYPSAGDRGQPGVRWIAAEPPVHLREHVGLCVLREYARRGSAIAEVDNGARRLPLWFRRLRGSLAHLPPPIAHCIRVFKARSALNLTCRALYIFSVKIILPPPPEPETFLLFWLRAAPRSRCVINQ